jgi:GGDEF domain-containing protein
VTATDLRRRVRRALWGPPAVLLPALAAGLAAPEGVESTLLPWIAIVLWPALLLLSLVLAHSRLFFTSLLGLLAWFTFQPAAATRFLPAPALPVVVLFPVALGAMVLLSERGVFGEAALWAWIVALLFAFLYLLWAQGPPAFAPELRAFFSEPLEAIPGTLSPLDTLYLISALFLGSHAVITDRLTDGVDLGLLTACYLATNDAVPADQTVAWSVAPLSAAAALLFETYALAYVDTLTRLPARRAMESYGKRLGHSFAVAMIDIDHFKQFNDTHGHHVGDQVLRMVAGRLSSVGSGGKVFRYGGEEFTILFRHDDMETIVGELEGLRKSVGGRPFVIRGSSRPPDRKGRKRRGWSESRQKATVTISVGVAVKSSRERKVEEVRKRADEALYKAKKKGRDRVEKG